MKRTIKQKFQILFFTLSFIITISYLSGVITINKMLNNIDSLFNEQQFAISVITSAELSVDKTISLRRKLV